MGGRGSGRKDNREGLRVKGREEKWEGEHQEWIEGGRKDKREILRVGRRVGGKGRRVWKE